MTRWPHDPIRTTAVALSAMAVVVLGVIGAAEAETMRYAFTTDVQTLDPHGLNETFTLGFQGNIYEGLVRRDRELRMEPALAVSWEMPEPTRWRFHLRRNVRFHNGNAFTADDVVFSAERTQAEGSDVQSRLAGVVKVVKIDDFTVDFLTDMPNPTLPFEWDTWYIMDREWAEAHDTTHPTNLASGTENYANRNANGTGPFRIVERQPDLRTVAVPWEGWWDTPSHNLTKVIYQPIAADATRIAALLAGDIDVNLQVPLQDLDRVDRSDGVRALTGSELRTMFLGMDQSRDELLYSNVRGANPFKDVRVRKAFYQAIDINAIQRVVMRGRARPSAAMVAPGVNGYPEDLERWPYDPDAARQLLAEAGYPNGFRLTMDCPNDRYVNDEAICQAIVGMLARIGVTIDLLTQTRSKYFAKILGQGGYDTSFYLLGWTPSGLDSYGPLRDLVHTRTGIFGTFNSGGYSNPAIDRLSDRILTTTDTAERDALIAEAWRILHEDVGYIPLHQQSLSWGAREGIELVQRADNQFLWRFVRVH